MTPNELRWNIANTMTNLQIVKAIEKSKDYKDWRGLAYRSACHDVLEARKNE